MFDRHTLNALLWGVTAFLTVMLLGSWLFPPPPPRPVPVTGEPGAVDSPVRPDDGAASEPPATGAAPPAAATSRFEVLEADAVETVQLGADLTRPVEEGGSATESPFRMALAFSNIGASIESATLTDHFETTKRDTYFRLLNPVKVSDQVTRRSLSVDHLNLDDVDVPLLDRAWHVERFTQDGVEGVRFRLEIAEASKPILRLTRAYRLPPQSRESMLHDLYADLKVENLDDKPHSVILKYSGAVGVPRLDARADARAADVGLLEEGEVSVRRSAYTQIRKAGGGGKELFDVDSAPAAVTLAWAATVDQYFTCTIAPQARGGGNGASYIRHVSATDLAPLSAQPEIVAMEFVTRRETLAAGAALDYPAEVYVGDKSRKAFKQVDRYAARNYYAQISQSYGFCTFSWLVELMMWLLDGLHAICRDYGVALILLVLIVRTILHPITKSGQVGMVRMQKQMGLLGPKMEEIKRKYANDKTRINQETMKLYQQEGINPMVQMMTCVPMLLQMPIWVALYISLSNNILMRHEPFLFTWVRDLTAPDALIPFSAAWSIPLIGQIHSFNLLPFLLALAMYTQQKLMPKPTPAPNQTKQQREQQEMMQKMMPIMSFMMLFFFYSAPSGLTLYVMSSSVFGTIEQHRIRKHIKEQEAAGTFDRKPAKAGGGLAAGRKGGSSFWTKLQKAAEEAQKRRK